MKGIRLMIICVLLLGFNACSDEDDIHVNVEDSWYNLEDDPSDPVQHYIYQLQGLPNYYYKGSGSGGLSI